MGRLFAKGEADLTGPPPAPGSPPIPLPPFTILSYELWQTAFGGRSNILGQTVEVNGLPREVIGIMPPGADVMDNRTEIWMPSGLNPGFRQNRGSHFLYLIGRLKDGVTPQQAQTELTSLIQNWGERVGVKQHVFSRCPRATKCARTNPGAGHLLQMEPVQEEIVGSASRAIWVLQAAVGFVLLIACANLANLLLARAETRHREFAVRTALGAGRGRLLRQFMTEGVLLSIVGGVLGLLLARAGVQALIRFIPTSLPRTSEVTVDPLVLLFTLGVSIATGLVFGLAPLMHTEMSGPDDGAQGRRRERRDRRCASSCPTRTGDGGGRACGDARDRCGTAVAHRGQPHQRRCRLRPRATGDVLDGPPDRRLPAAAGSRAVYERVLDKLRAVPGVQTATAMSGLPPNRPLNANDTDIDNYTAPPEGPFENVDYYQNVMTDYFETMGVPIVQGRSFHKGDAGATGMVAVVNETLVNTFWKDQNPIGQRLRPCCGDQIPWFTVVGVAKDVKQGGVDQRTGTEFYFLIDQTAQQPPPFSNAPANMNVVLRTTVEPGALRQTLDRVVREADPSVPIVRLRDMNGVFEESIRRPRLLAQLLGGFAGLALLLAAIGTYGVLSYMVAERRREIGIRMALGADQGSVLTGVLKQGLVLTTVGIVIGLGGAFALNQLIASLLYGVKPTDPITLVSVVATITLVAAVACGLPAWRASRMDPNIVLRQE